MPNIREDIQALLLKHWGYKEFRPLQQEIILSTLSGKDVLALLPTGGGKSICFQVPGLALGGTTLVISPLVALMNDQVENLRKRGISAVAITAAMNRREIDVALNNAALGHVQFLYVSPERLQNEAFRQAITHLPITLIAVDEAHCISQWGYDFRPSYARIAELRPYFSKVNIIALTASATGEVVADIQRKLDFKEAQVFHQSFNRANLRYIVQREDNKAGRLLKLIRNIGGSGICYVRSRKRTIELAQWLVKQGIGAGYYHAGMKYEERQQVQQDWIQNKIQVVCATNAFGMGIDKPDVRFVVHLDLPESLEAYFQEAGRAGRDGKAAWCTVFFGGPDEQKLLDNLEASFPALEQVRQVYQALCNYFQVALGAGEGLSYVFDVQKLCASYNLSAKLVANSIWFLEREGVLSLLDAGHAPSRVMVTAGKDLLYDFQLRLPAYEPLIKTLLRSYGGLFGDYVTVSENELGKRIRKASSFVVSQLSYLDQEGILSYVPQTTLPSLLFLQSRVHARELRLSPENYDQLRERQEARVKSVLQYVNNGKLCRQVQLLLYFNEHDYSSCGHCDVCISQRNIDQGTVKEKIVALLRREKLTLDQLARHMSVHNDRSWVQAFNELIDDGILQEVQGKYGAAETIRQKER